MPSSLQVVRIATDICKALAFLQDLKKSNGMDLYDQMDEGSGSSDGSNYPPVLSAYALRTVVTPSNVMIDSQVEGPLSPAQCSVCLLSAYAHCSFSECLMFLPNIMLSACSVYMPTQCACSVLSVPVQYSCSLFVLRVMHAQSMR
jgi:hypothetical protein